MQFSKKKKRKVRVTKIIKEISDYLSPYIPGPKEKRIKDLNELLKIPNDTWAHIGTNTNPVCMYSPYTNKRRKLVRKSK